MITPIRRKIAVRKNLPSVGGMPINLDFDKQSNIPLRKVPPPLTIRKPTVREEHNNSMLRGREVIKPCFIYKEALYQLTNKRTDAKWNGVYFSPSKPPITVPKEDCILLGKQEPLILLYFVLLQRIEFLTQNEVHGSPNNDLHAVFENIKTIKYIEEIIIENFTE